MNFLFYR